MVSLFHTMRIGIIALCLAVVCLISGASWRGSQLVAEFLLVTGVLRCPGNCSRVRILCVEGLLLFAS